MCFQLHFFRIGCNSGFRKRFQNLTFLINFSTITIFRKLQKPLKKQWFFWIFQVSSLQKTTQNVYRNSFEKNIQKNKQKINFGVRFGFPKPQKAFQNHSKSLREAKRREACFAMLCKSPRNRRKATGVIVCKASIWLRI